MPRIAGVLQALQYVLPRKLQATNTVFLGDLLGSQHRLVVLLGTRLLPLLLYRLALPPTCHRTILDSSESNRKAHRSVKGWAPEAFQKAQTRLHAGRCKRLTRAASLVCCTFPGSGTSAPTAPRTKTSAAFQLLSELLKQP